MLFSDPLKRNKLLFWLAVGWGAASILDSVLHYTNPIHFIRTYGITSIGYIASFVLFLLCTLGKTASHLMSRLYPVGIIAYCAPYVYSILSDIFILIMGGYSINVWGIISIALTALYTIALVIITVFLFTRKYQPWLFTAFCASAGAWFALGIVLRIMDFVIFAIQPDLWQLLWQLFYILFAALPIIFIAITLWTGCFFPPEMRLRQLMSMRAAGKLDEVSYQEQRAEVIENL